MLEIRTQITGKNTLITLDGQFNALGAIDFDSLTAGIALENRNVILDFNQVTFLSSAGVRSILKLEKSVRTIRGALYICGMSDNVRQVLEISGISRFLKITLTVDEALKLIDKANQSGLLFESGSASYRIRTSSVTGSELVIWNRTFKPKTWDTPADRPLLASSREFTFAIRDGSFVQGDQPDESQRGDLLTIGQFTGLRPFDKAHPYDYIIADLLGSLGIYIWDGLSFTGDPDAEITLQTKNEVPLSRIIRDLFQVMTRTGQHIPEIMGMILEVNLAEKATVPDRKNTAKTVLIGAAAIHYTALVDRNDPEILDYFVSKNWSKVGDDILYKAIGVFTSKSEDRMSVSGNRPIPEPDPDNLLDLEDIQGIISARGWIYLPEEFIPASSRRLHIVRKDDSYFPDAWEFIARDLYRNSSKLILTPIHGGFSASTYFADSFDKEGRRQLPTVLKIAGKEIIDREESNYHEYVKKYILNNSTSILGTSVFQQWKGLCYSFVGITGPDSSIEWLTKHYRNRPVEELLPLFDRIFTHILKPWYGQPRLEPIHPYRDHDPRRVFFPNLCRNAEEELGISVKEKYVRLSGLQREIINPYWFLENVFEQRKNYQKLWYRCIAHRDLNMQNILLDEIENVYIIDFSETGPGNAIADFARLEPILKIEMSRLATEEDLLQMVEFEQGLIESTYIDQLPVYRYRGDDPNVPKAYQLICRLRQYADVVTLFEKDIEPYLLAVLEWTLPVVSYKGVDTLRKQYSACSSALICEKILALTGER